MRDPGINVPHLAQHMLTSACFVLYHHEHCNLRPMLNTITHDSDYNLDLQCARETKHNNNLYRKNQPKWDEKTPKKSPTNIPKYFEIICGTSKAPFLYMLCQHIVPLKHNNLAQGYYNTDRTMIKRCPIIPIEQHGIYANGVDAELLKGLHDVRSPKYLLDSVMCYAELKIITQNTSAKTCINMFCRTHNFCAAYKKLRLTFFGLGFTQRCARQLEDELQSLRYKGEYKHSNFQMYIACHEQIFQQMQNLKTDGYDEINFGTCVRYFLSRIEEPSLKTAVQICESQDSYSVNFQACASYLATMVQWTPATKRVNVTANATNVDGVKLKNWDGTDRRIPPAKYSAGVYKKLSPKQKEWLWQNTKKAKANGEDIPAAKRRWGQPPLSRPSASSLLWRLRKVRSIVSLPRTRK